MHPELVFSLGSLVFEVKAYDLFMLLGAVAVFGGSFWFVRRRGLPLAHSFAVLALTAAALLVGSRLLHVLTNVEAYRTAPQLIWSFSLARLALFGGVVMAVLVAVGTCRWLGLKFWQLADAVVLPFGVGLALVRVGCFLNGCCFGRETDLPWGVKFPLFSEAHKSQLLNGTGELFTVHAVHPTQLYELAAALFGVVVAAIIMRRSSRSGLATLTFAALFLAYRLLAWPLRPIPPTFDAFIYTYPILYALLLLLAALLFRRRLKVAN